MSSTASDNSDIDDDVDDDDDVDADGDDDDVDADGDDGDADYHRMGSLSIGVGIFDPRESIHFNTRRQIFIFCQKI